jgi:hypothetical protein
MNDERTDLEKLLDDALERGDSVIRIYEGTVQKIREELAALRKLRTEDYKRRFPSPSDRGL